MNANWKKEMCSLNIKTSRECDRLRCNYQLLKIIFIEKIDQDFKSSLNFLSLEMLSSL